MKVFWYRKRNKKTGGIFWCYFLVCRSFFVIKLIDWGHFLIDSGHFFIKVIFYYFLIDWGHFLICRSYNIYTFQNLLLNSLYLFKKFIYFIYFCSCYLNDNVLWSQNWISREKKKKIRKRNNNNHLFWLI